MDNKKLAKYLGWSTVLSGVAYVYYSSKVKDFKQIDGFGINIDADKLVKSGVNEFKGLSEEHREKLENGAKSFLNRFIAPRGDYE